jgi:hypothetical protein
VTAKYFTATIAYLLLAVSQTGLASDDFANVATTQSATATALPRANFSVDGPSSRDLAVSLIKQIGELTVQSRSTPSAYTVDQTTVDPTKGYSCRQNGTVERVGANIRAAMAVKIISQSPNGQRAFSANQHFIITPSSITHWPDDKAVNFYTWDRLSNGGYPRSVRTMLRAKEWVDPDIISRGYENKPITEVVSDWSSNASCMAQRVKCPDALHGSAFLLTLQLPAEGSAIHWLVDPDRGLVVLNAWSTSKGEVVDSWIIRYLELPAGVWRVSAATHGSFMHGQPHEQQQAGFKWQLGPPPPPERFTVSTLPLRNGVQWYTTGSSGAGTTAQIYRDGKWFDPNVLVQMDGAQPSAERSARAATQPTSKDGNVHTRDADQVAQYNGARSTPWHLNTATIALSVSVGLCGLVILLIFIKRT